MRRGILLPAAGALLAGAAPLAGCGARAADLFALRRDGNIPGARLSLVVSDGGTVRCNGGRSRELPSRLLLDARDLTRRVAEDAGHHRRYPPRPDSVLSYTIRTEDGTVRWADTSRPLPPRYFQLAFLTRRIAQGVCGLAR